MLDKIKKTIRRTKRSILKMWSDYNVKKQYRQMAKGIEIKKLTKEQKELVHSYYKERIGKKINLRWHQYYYSINDIFTPEYIPLDLYYSTISEQYNDLSVSKAYADKNFSDILFPNILHPKNFLKNINGFFYSQGRVITKDEALKKCANLDNVFIKYAIDTSHGKNVYRFSSVNGITNIENKSVEELFNYYGKNFIVQEAVKQHEILSKLNPSSVNTIRLTTLRRENDVVCISSVVRIGGKDAQIDNVTAGGVYCGINEDGTLKKYSFGIYPTKKYTKTHTGITLEGYEIPFYSQLLETAQKMHLFVPYCRIVGWDFSVDTNGNFVLIELNTHKPGVYQLVEPAFGKYTDEVLRSIRKQ